MAKKVVVTPRGGRLIAAAFPFVYPRLAADSRQGFTSRDLLPLAAALKKGVPFREQKGRLVEATKRLLKGKLAQDADLEDVAKLMDAIEDVIEAPAGGPDLPPTLGEPELEGSEVRLEDVDDDGEREVVRDDEPDPMVARIREFIKNLGVSDEVLAQFDQLVSSEAEPEDVTGTSLPPPEDNDDDEERNMSRDRKMARDRGAGKMPAMDEAAFQTAVERSVERLLEGRVNAAIKKDRERSEGVLVALDEVQPVVGRLGRMAYDSADEVYGAALRASGYDLTGIAPTAFKPMFAVHKSNAVKMAAATAAGGRGTAPRIANDAAATAGAPSFEEMFPSAARVRVRG